MPLIFPRFGRFLLVLLAFSLVIQGAEAKEMTARQLLAIRTVSNVVLSPDGRNVAYLLSSARDLTQDEDGRAWSELYVVSAETGKPRLYVGRPVQVSEARFTPDGQALTYLAKRDDDAHKAIYRIPLAGGESRKIVEFETDVLGYRISPDGKRIAFIATPDIPKERNEAKEKGYDAEVFEEQWLPRKVWVATLPAIQSMEPESAEVPLPLDGSAFDLRWLPDGTRLAIAVAPRPLIDDSYMLKRIRVVDATSGDVTGQIDNPGKLGAFEVSPDGTRIAMISAADPNDPKEGRLMVAPIEGGRPKDLLPDLPAHVQSLAWTGDSTLVTVIDRGTETQLAQVGLDGQLQELAFSGATGETPVLHSVAWSARTKRGAFVGDSPSHPAEVFVRFSDNVIQRRTHSNPELAYVSLAPQEVIRHQAKDGFPLEGILVRPLEPKLGTPAPLVLMVHGGPESHMRNGWVSNYSRPAQLLASRGYAVFLPNYRGSTGFGVASSKSSQGDAAGKEFSDLIDAVDHLVELGIADTDRVGITGGSYGGYATAWASTYYTDRFRAGVMFVGISNKLSKGFTTDIPVEDKMVHTLFDPWTRWQYSLERSPLFYAEKSRTPLLIMVGKDDPRVHPSQSLQMYRALKLVGKTPVRLVRYPGEGHGNRRSASREDYLHRTLRWFDHFLLTDAKDLPPAEVEGYFGIETKGEAPVDPTKVTDPKLRRKIRQQRRADKLR